MEFHFFADVVLQAEDVEDAKWRIAQCLTHITPEVARKLYEIKGDIEVHPADKCAEYNF